MILNVWGDIGFPGSWILSPPFNDLIADRTPSEMEGLSEIDVGFLA